MITWYYLIIFIISLILSLSCLLRNKNIDTLFVLLFIAIVANCMGRYVIASAQSLDMALFGNKILYVGAVYAPLLMLIVLSRLCDIKLSRLFIGIMTLYSTIVFGFVLTIGKSTIYYENVELVFADGYTYFVKTYGPMHMLYYIMVVLYAISMIGFVAYSFRKKSYVSSRTVLMLSFTSFSIISIYLLERILKIEISILSLGYLVGISLLVRHYDYLNMYNMSSNIVNTIEKMREYGYVVFDTKYRYISTNDMIRELFPEVNQWTVDKVVAPSDSFLYKEVVSYLMEYDENTENNKTIQVGEFYFQLTIREISYGRKGKIGYLLEFVDRTAEQKYYHAIEEYNINLEKEVNIKTEKLVHIKDSMILGMADMVENRDNNTGDHIKRTSEVVKIFSEKLMECSEEFGVNDTFLALVAKAAPMHDLGKISIDDAILRKPGKYEPEEFNEMKRHTSEGARIVESLLENVEDKEFVQIATNIAHYHHEKWNGQGYPRGIGGIDIPIEARIMALADVYDALVSKRCYKEAYSYEKAYEIIEESLGTHFDPKLGKIFLSCSKELQTLYEQKD